MQTLGKSEAPLTEVIEENIFSALVKVARDVTMDKTSAMGAIVVFGDFYKDCSVLIQMKPKKNPIENPVEVGSESGIKIIKKYSRSPYDGAVVIDKTGKIISAGIYLVVRDPTIDIPDGCGTRHKAAASFSLHNETISVLTLSEETNTVRLWRNGKVERKFEVQNE